MNDRMLAGMLEATRLTNAGRLREATATIQRTLGGAHAPEASSADPTRPLRGISGSSTPASSHHPGRRTRPVTAGTRHLFISAPGHAHNPARTSGPRSGHG